MRKSIPCLKMGVLAALMIPVLPACKDNSFGGGNKTQPTQKPAPAPAVPGTTNPTPDNCPKATQATVLTKTVSLSQANPEIKYEISVADCVGSLIALRYFRKLWIS